MLGKMDCATYYTLLPVFYENLLGTPVLYSSILSTNPWQDKEIIA